MGSAVRPGQSVDPFDQALKESQGGAAKDPFDQALAESQTRQPFLRRFGSAVSEMVQHPINTAASVITAPAHAMATGARFMAQTAAEQSLPDDVRANYIRSNDPERISDREAGIAAAQLAVPMLAKWAVPLAGASGIGRAFARTAAGASIGAVYNPEDPAVGAAVGGVAGAATEGVSRFRARTAAQAPAAETPGVQPPARPITATARMLPPGQYEMPEPRSPITDAYRLLPAAPPEAVPTEGERTGPAIPMPAVGAGERPPISDPRFLLRMPQEPDRTVQYPHQAGPGIAAPPVPPAEARRLSFLSQYHRNAADELESNTSRVYSSNPEAKAQVVEQHRAAAADAESKLAAMPNPQADEQARSELEARSATPTDVEEYQRRRDAGLAPQAPEPLRGPGGTLRRPGGGQGGTLFDQGPQRLRLPGEGRGDAFDQALRDAEPPEDAGDEERRAIQEEGRASDMTGLTKLGYTKSEIAQLGESDVAHILKNEVRSPSAKPLPAEKLGTVAQRLVKLGYTRQQIKNMHPDNAAWLAEQGETLEPTEPEFTEARDKSGNLKANLANVHADELSKELSRLYEANIPDSDFTAANESMPSTLSYRETRSDVSRAGKPLIEDAKGIEGAERQPEAARARVRAENRQKAIDKVEAELSRRGINPAEALRRAHGAEDATDFRFGGMPMLPETRRAVGGFIGKLFHDPFITARRADPELAGLADETVAAKNYAQHAAEAAAAKTEKGLTPIESHIVSRIQIVDRLRSMRPAEQTELEDTGGDDQTREENARRIEALIPPGAREDPRIKYALERRKALYRDVVEPKAIEANVPPEHFSRSPSGHIKLSPVPEEELGDRPITSARLFGGTRTARAAAQAKGTAFDYETDYRKLLHEDMRDKFVVAAQNNFYRAIADRVAAGQYREVPPNARVAANEGKVTVRDPANIIDDPQGRKFTVAMPKDEAEMVRKVDQTLNAPPSGTARRVLDAVAGRLLFTINPAEKLGHARNVMAAVGSVPELGPEGWGRAGTGMVPGVKQLRGLHDILSVDMDDPNMQDIKMRLAKQGALRPHRQEMLPVEKKLQSKWDAAVDRAKAGLSPELSDKLSRMTVFGRDGFDERGRVALATKYLSVKPDATDAELGRYVNRLAGNYTRGLGGVAVDALQNMRLAIFARAQTAKLGLGLRALTGESLLPAENDAQAAELRVKQLMQGPIGSRIGRAAVIAAVAAAGVGLAKVARGNEGDIPTGQKEKNTGRDVYVRGKFLNPSDEAVLHDLGMDAALRGDAKGVQQALRNASFTYGASHPFTRALAAFYGVELQQDREGKFRVIGSPNLERTTTAKNVGAAITQLTSLRSLVSNVPPNPGMPEEVGRPLGFAGLNVTSASQPAAKVETSINASDAIGFRDRVIHAIRSEHDAKARIKIAMDARQQMRDDTKKNPALGEALERARVERAIMRSIGRP